jgi:hypothetical protein
MLAHLATASSTNSNNGVLYRIGLYTLEDLVFVEQAQLLLPALPSNKRQKQIKNENNFSQQVCQMLIEDLGGAVLFIFCFSLIFQCCASGNTP